MTAKFAFIAAEKADPASVFPVVKRCRWLRVSTSGLSVGDHRGRYRSSAGRAGGSFLPRSKVSERRKWSGRSTMAAAITSFWPRRRSPQRRAVLDARLDTPSVQAWQVQQHRESGGPTSVPTADGFVSMIKSPSQ